MNELNVQELSEWCRARALHVELPNRLYFDPSVRCTAYSIGMPADFDGRVAVVRAILFPSDHAAFLGGVVWLASWGMGDDVVGPCLYDALRLKFSLHPGAEGTTTTRFSPSEADECLTFLALFAVVGWDAYFVHERGQYVASVSNDGFVDVAVGDPALEQQVLSAINTWAPERIADEMNRYSGNWVGRHGRR